MCQIKIHLVIYCSVLLSLNVPAQKPATLDFYLEAAASNSPLLNDYNQQVYAVKLDSMKLLADYGFILSGEGAASYAPVFKGWGYENALSNGHPVTAMIRASRELISKRNLDSRLASYYLNVLQLRNQSALSELQLKKNITDLYITTFISQQQYKAIQDILKLLVQEDTILKKLTQAAVFKQTDYLSFKVTQQQNELALEQKRAEWYNNFALLNYASGLIDTIPKTLQLSTSDTDTIVPFEESIYSQSYKTDSMKLANDAYILEYSYKPKIGAYADAGYQSTLIQTPYKNFGWSAGITLSVPLYDGRKKQMSLQQNKIALQSRSKYLEFEKNQYNQQIAQITNQIGHYRQMIATASEQLQYSRTLIEANAKQLPTGDVKVVDFILAITNYYNLRLGLIQYEGTLFNLQNQLHYLTIQ